MRKERRGGEEGEEWRKGVGEEWMREVGEERMREVGEKWVGGGESIKESMAINAGKNDKGKKMKYSREKGSVKVNEVTAQNKRAILRWRGREEEHSYSKF